MATAAKLAATPIALPHEEPLGRLELEPPPQRADAQAGQFLRPLRGTLGHRRVDRLHHPALRQNSNNTATAPASIASLWVA